MSTCCCYLQLMIYHMQGGPGTKLEPETRTVGIVFQEPKAEAEAQEAFFKNQNRNRIFLPKLEEAECKSGQPMPTICPKRLCSAVWKLISKQVVCHMLRNNTCNWITKGDRKDSCKTLPFVFLLLPMPWC